MVERKYRTMQINEDLLQGVAVVFDLAVEEVSSDEVECLLMEAIEKNRDFHRNKAEALQRALSTQYIKYDPENYKFDEEEEDTDNE